MLTTGFPSRCPEFGHLPGKRHHAHMIGALSKACALISNDWSAAFPHVVLTYLKGLRVSCVTLLTQWPWKAAPGCPWTLLMSLAFGWFCTHLIPIVCGGKHGINEHGTDVPKGNMQFLGLYFMQIRLFCPKRNLLRWFYFSYISKEKPRLRNIWWLAWGWLNKKSKG